MGLLTNSDYGTTPLQRTLAAGIKRCQLGDVREIDRQPGENGEVKGPLSKMVINLTLEEPAETTDKDTVQAGFPTVVTINVWDRPGDLEKAQAKVRELGLALLQLERGSKENVKAKIDAQGGWSAMKGKSLLVEFTIKGGYNEAKHFNRIPAPAA